MLWFVRYGIGILVCVAGVAAMLFGPEEARYEGGAAIIGAGLAILLLNFLFRIGAQGDAERDDEEDARAYYAKHGRWPDERPPSRHS